MARRDSFAIVPGYTFGWQPSAALPSWEDWADPLDDEGGGEDEDRPCDDAEPGRGFADHDSVLRDDDEVSAEESARLSCISVASGRRKTISAEVYDATEDAEFHPRVFAKSQGDIGSLTKIMESHFLFKHLDDRELAKVVLYMSPETYYPGQVLREEGEDADLEVDSLFHVILEGTCDVQVNGVENGTLGPGCTFGETGMMYPDPPAELCVATSVVRCYRLDRHTYQWTLRSTFANKRALYCRFLANVRFLEGLSQPAVVQLADCLVSRKYRAGDALIQCDAPPQWMYIVMEGVVRVVGRDEAARPIPVCEFSEGAIVGELEFLHNHNSVADVVVVSEEARVARLERHHFELCMGPLKALLESSRQADPNYTYYHRRRAEMQRREESTRSDSEMGLPLEAPGSATFSDGAASTAAVVEAEAELRALRRAAAEEAERLREAQQRRQHCEAEAEAASRRLIELQKEAAQRASEAEHYALEHRRALEAEAQQLALREAAVTEGEERVRRLSASLKACQEAQATHLQAEEARLAAERDALQAQSEALARRQAAVAQREGKDRSPARPEAVATQLAAEQARLAEVQEQRRRLAGELLHMQRQALELSRWLAKEEARCEAMVRVSSSASHSASHSATHTNTYTANIAGETVTFRWPPGPGGVGGTSPVTPPVNGGVSPQAPLPLSRQRWLAALLEEEAPTLCQPDILLVKGLESPPPTGKATPPSCPTSPPLHRPSSHHLPPTGKAAPLGRPPVPDRPPAGTLLPPHAAAPAVALAPPSPSPRRWSYCTAPANAPPHSCRSPSCPLCGALGQTPPPPDVLSHPTPPPPGP